LRQLGCDTNIIDVFGLAFQQSQPQSISISSLTKKMLCENHNNLLSPLDDAAGRFFEVSLRIIENFQQAPAISLFAGEDIELWLLKTLIGIIESGQSSVYTDTGLEKSTFTLDPVCSKILFQKSPWPAGWGVHVDRGISPSNGHFLVTPNVEDNKVTGAHFRVCGKQFFLNLGARHIYNPPYDIIRPIGSQSRLFRPTILSHLRGNDSRQIVLTWEGLSKQSFCSNNRLCTLVWVPESEELPPEDLSNLFLVIEPKPKT
jgi:hypothetical protein